MTTTSDNGNARIFKTRSLCRRLTDSMGWRVLVLGVLVTALAARVGLALSPGTAEVRAQDAVMLHETTITVGTYPEYDVFDGYSNVPGGVGGYDELVFGAIDQPSFEYEGTQYEVLALYLHNHFDVMYLMIDPLFQPIKTQRPTLTIAGETYQGQATSLALGTYIWQDAPLDWDVGDTVQLTLELATVKDADTDPNLTGNPDAAQAVNALAGTDEGGGTSRWVGWLAGIGAVVVASVGYGAYRLLR
jgi:hypothetical protein